MTAYTHTHSTELLSHPCPFIFKLVCLTPEVPPEAALSLCLCLRLCLNGFIRLEAVCSHPTALINISLPLSHPLSLFLTHTHICSLMVTMGSWVSDRQLNNTVGRVPVFFFYSLSLSHVCLPVISTLAAGYVSTWHYCPCLSYPTVTNPSVGLKRCPALKFSCSIET